MFLLFQNGTYGYIMYINCHNIELVTWQYKPTINPLKVIYPDLSSLKQPHLDEILAHYQMSERRGMRARERIGGRGAME